MNTSFKHTERRDFVDFLLLLYRHSRIFYMTFASLLFLAILINYFQSPKYKFNVEIKIPESNDIFMPVIMYRDNLRQASNEPAFNKEEKEFSSLGVGRLINDLLIGGRVFNNLDNKIREVIPFDSNLSSVIDSKRKNDYFVVDVKSTDKLLVKNIHEYIIPIVQQEIKTIYEGIIETHRTNSLNTIQSLIKSDTASQLRIVSTELLKSKITGLKSTELLNSNSNKDNYTEELKENAVYSAYNEKLDFIKNLEMPNLDLPYIYFRQTDIEEDSEIPTFFVYIFAVFLSIFLFVLIVIMMDLKNQVFIRKEISN